MPFLFLISSQCAGKTSSVCIAAPEVDAPVNLAAQPCSATSLSFWTGLNVSVIHLPCVSSSKKEIKINWTKRSKVSTNRCSIHQFDRNWDELHVSPGATCGATGLFLLKPSETSSHLETKDAYLGTCPFRWSRYLWIVCIDARPTAFRAIHDGNHHGTVILSLQDSFQLLLTLCHCLLRQDPDFPYLWSQAHF